MKTPKGHHPPNPYAGSLLQGHDKTAEAKRPKRAEVALAEWSETEAVAASVAGILAAVTDNGTERVITSGLTKPPCARTITATSAGTAGDITAIQVLIEGKRDGKALSFALPVFTENNGTTVESTLALDEVTKVTIPAHDGNGATTSIGWGEKLGFPTCLERNTVIKGSTYLGTTREGTDPTMTVDADELEKNTIDLNSALNGSKVLCYYLVP